jgi:hypothetical protein
VEEIQHLKRNFDVLAYLEDTGVGYSLEGDNVSEGWVNIQCPFCSDHANHCGIHYAETKLFSCWLCGERGDVISLVRELEGVGHLMAVERLAQHQELSFNLEEEKEEEYPKRRKNILPATAVPIVEGREPPPVRRFMEARRFPLGYCQRYKVYWDGLGGEYPLSIIVPVFVDGIVVSWQAVNTVKQENKYRHCPKSRAALPNNRLLYGLDDVREARQVVLVEGVFDRWRIGGDQSVALFSKNVSLEQLAMIKERLWGKRLKVLLDVDAQDEALRLCVVLGELGGLDVAPPLLLESGDPDDLDEAGVRAVLEM